MLPRLCVHGHPPFLLINVVASTDYRLVAVHLTWWRSAVDQLDITACQAMVACAVAVMSSWWHSVTKSLARLDQYPDRLHCTYLTGAPVCQNCKHCLYAPSGRHVPKFPATRPLRQQLSYVKASACKLPTSTDDCIAMSSWPCWLLTMLCIA